MVSRRRSRRPTRLTAGVARTYGNSTRRCSSRPRRSTRSWPASSRVRTLPESSYGGGSEAQGAAVASGSPPGLPALPVLIASTGRGSTGAGRRGSHIHSNQTLHCQFLEEREGCLRGFFLCELIGAGERGCDLTPAPRAVAQRQQVP